jgi:hypothetical protein
MEGSLAGDSKETVIVVHGTWAAPQEGTNKWYQLNDGTATNGDFLLKLDNALETRGSSARCWAHCANNREIFSWSGNNSWIDRTRAAGQLAQYVGSLLDAGWRCHIVAHSHGGNVVAEALPAIMTSSASNNSFITVTTLGSPFIDAIMSIRGLQRTSIVVKFLFFLLAFVAVSATVFSDTFKIISAVHHGDWSSVTLGTKTFCYWASLPHLA